jgi:hypothetical protein
MAERVAEVRTKSTQKSAVVWKYSQITDQELRAGSWRGNALEHWQRFMMLILKRVLQKQVTLTYVLDLAR